MTHLPTANIDAARLRAQTNQKIRNFFTWRGVLEVQTPVLSQAGATDPHLASVTANVTQSGKAQAGFLHTSPEFAMKRLLAAWQVPIFQICPVFRDGEQGKHHNIEFSMLEWYRPHYSLSELANELAELLSSIMGYDVVFNHTTYAQAFLDYADTEPFSATVQELEQVAILHDIKTSLRQASTHVSVMAPANAASMPPKKEDNGARSKADGSEGDNPAGSQGGQENTSDSTISEADDALKQAWLDLLYSHLVEPNLGQDMPTLVLDFPASQASLAKVATNAQGRRIAKRFELYINGVELANAYEELADAEELRMRFTADNALRQKQGLPTMPIDENLLAALNSIPPCSGIALGLDRLLMVLGKYTNIQEVIHFPSERA